MSSRAVVVLPTYNEAENITPMLEALKRVRDSQVAYELTVLVVDDNSPDGTSDIVKNIQKKNRYVHLLNGSKEGLGRAYVRGFRHALSKLKADVVIQMDADFSHDPYRIPSLLEAIDGGADYVIGSRYVANGSIPGNWPLLRIINSRVANFVSHKIGGLDDSIADTTGGFKAIRAEALKTIDLDKVGAAGYVFQVVLLQAFVDGGYRISEVPINFVDRTAGESKIRTSDIVEFFKVAYGLNPNSPFRQLLRFMAVGASGVIVNLSGLYLLTRLADMPPLPASIVATELSVLSNFMLNNFFTFRGASLQSRAEFLRGLSTYHAAVAAGFGLTILSFIILNNVLGVHDLIAQATGVGLSFMANYWLSRKFVWGKADVVA